MRLARLIVAVHRGARRRAVVSLAAARLPVGCGRVRSHMRRLTLNRLTAARTMSVVMRRRRVTIRFVVRTAFVVIGDAIHRRMTVDVFLTMIAVRVEASMSPAVGTGHPAVRVAAREQHVAIVARRDIGDPRRSDVRQRPRRVLNHDGRTGRRGSGRRHDDGGMGGMRRRRDDASAQHGDAGSAGDPDGQVLVVQTTLR